MTGEKEKGQHVATHSRTLTLFSFVRRAFVFPIAMHVLYLKKSPSQQYRKQNVKVYTYVPFENKMTSSCVLHLICCTSPIVVCF